MFLSPAGTATLAARSCARFVACGAGGGACSDFELALILSLGAVDVKGLFFGGALTPLASSEEEEEEDAEEDDEGGFGFVRVGLVVGGVLEAAAVEEVALGASFWAAFLLGASTTSLLLLLLESEEGTFFLFACATGGFLLPLTGCSTLTGVFLVEAAGLGVTVGPLSSAFFLFFFSVRFPCDILVLSSTEACSASLSSFSSLPFFLLFFFHSTLTPFSPAPVSSVGLGLFLPFSLADSGQPLFPFT